MNPYVSVEVKWGRRKVLNTNKKEMNSINKRIETYENIQNKAQPHRANIVIYLFIYKKIN